LYVAFPQVCPQISATIVDKRAEAGLEAIGKTLKELIDEGACSAVEEGEAGADGADHGAVFARLGEQVEKALGEYREGVRTGSQRIAASAAEVKEAAIGTLSQLVDRVSVEDTRQNVLARFERFKKHAESVSAETAPALAELSAVLEETLPESLVCAGLDGARATFTEAAEAFAKALTAEESPAVADLAGNLGARLQKLASETIAAVEEEEEEAAAPPPRRRDPAGAEGRHSGGHGRDGLLPQSGWSRADRRDPGAAGPLRFRASGRVSRAVSPGLHLLLPPPPVPGSRP
ncbi:hypothetical protein ACFL59_15345, partial [Planctomycetota bacterium]